MEITLSNVTFDDWKAIIRKAVFQAKRGNTNARKFLADYLMGPPNQRMDITSGGERITTEPDVNALAEALAGLKPSECSEGCGGSES